MSERHWLRDIINDVLVLCVLAFIGLWLAAPAFMFLWWLTR